MRLEKAENLLKLALLMQAKTEGVSLTDIEEEFNVGRRTAERMRDAIGRLIPEMYEADTGERAKRWRIPSGRFSSIVRFNADELAELEAASHRLKREHLDDRAKILEDLSIKIKSILRSSENLRLETDIEALLEAEGYAMRPGPKLKISSDVLQNLRNAVKACLKVKITYKPVNSDQVQKRTVSPYGFLYGNRHYMIAWCDKAKNFRMFSLSNIIEAEVKETIFSRKKAFNLKEYAEQSFGVFQEEPFDVVWKFNADAAPNAKEYQFHPSQKIEDQEDGSLIVKFTAGGWKEMCWHLFTWEGAVEVIEPAELRDNYQKMLN